MRFWYWDGKRSPTFPAAPADNDLIRNGVFLFWGKLVSAQRYRVEDVLFLFDRLLDVYRYVEGNARLPKQSPELHRGFVFRPGCNERAETATAISKAESKEITLRHNKLQETLHAILVKTYGDDSVGSENDTGRGSRVDVVARDGSDYIYYEIKVSPSIRACVREALAQLIEYSLWPGGNRAKRLVIVSENPLTHDTDRYLKILRGEFQIPVYYQRLNMNAKTLEPRTIPDR